MPRRHYIKHLLVLLVALCTLAACATKTPPPPSGFMANYPNLKADKYGNARLLWWEASDFDWKRYRRVMLDPMVVYYHSEAATQEIRPDDLKRLTDEFRNVVVEELHGSYPVVETPGPDVLRVRAALTEVIPASPVLNAITTVLAFVPLDMGGASIEVEFIDSATNKRVAAMVERKLGTPFDVKSGFTSLGHAKASFKAWAAELKRALETGP